MAGAEEAREASRPTAINVKKGFAWRAGQLAAELGAVALESPFSESTEDELRRIGEAVVALANGLTTIRELLDSGPPLRSVEQPVTATVTVLPVRATPANHAEVRYVMPPGREDFYAGITAIIPAERTAEEQERAVPVSIVGDFELAGRGQTAELLPDQAFLLNFLSKHPEGTRGIVIKAGGFRVRSSEKVTNNALRNAVVSLDHALMRLSGRQGIVRTGAGGGMVYRLNPELDFIEEREGRVVFRPEPAAPPAAESEVAKPGGVKPETSKTELPSRMSIAAIVGYVRGRHPGIRVTPDLIERIAINDPSIEVKHADDGVIYFPTRVGLTLAHKIISAQRRVNGL